MVDYGDAAEIGPFPFRRFANRGFISQQSDPCDTLARTRRGCDDGPGIIAFGQDDVLLISGSALPNGL